MILSLIRQSAINYLCALENRKLIKLIIFYIRKYILPSFVQIQNKIFEDLLAKRDLQKYIFELCS